MRFFRSWPFLLSMKQQFEVEQKFVVTRDVQAKLADLKFKLLQSKSMLDIYYDTVQLDLVCQNYWFRYRKEDGKESSWELKRPVRTTVKNETTVYEELVDKEAFDAVKEVLKNYGVEGAPSSSSSPAIIHAPEVPDPGLRLLEPFARIHTTRTSYQRDDIRIDLDTTDRGYTVGEVELVVSSQDEIPDAQAKVQTLVQELGATSHKALGKLEQYLATERPDVLMKAIEAGIMKK